MKKLALVIALAVAASWMISDRSDRDPRSPRGTLRDVDQTIRHDLARVKRDLARGSKHRPRPVPPSETVSAEPVNVSNDFVWVNDPATSESTQTRGSTPPAWFPVTGEDVPVAPDQSPSGSTVLVGRLSASENRARNDLNEKLVRRVREWLAADIAPTWTPSDRELNSMTLDVYVQPVAQVFKPLPGEITETAAVPADPTAGKNSVLDDVYTLYRAGGRYDFSANRKARLIDVYRRQVVDHRLFRLGGGMVLALAGLAALVGYIRADEATKGFYTNRLRLLTAAGLGASGYAVYQVLAQH